METLTKLKNFLKTPSHMEKGKKDASQLSIYLLRANFTFTRTEQPKRWPMTSRTWCPTRVRQLPCFRISWLFNPPMNFDRSSLFECTSSTLLEESDALTCILAGALALSLPGNFPLLVMRDACSLQNLICRSAAFSLNRLWQYGHWI